MEKPSLIGDKLLAQGDAENALQKFLDALFQETPTAELFKKIGHCNKIMGENENAIEYYDKSLELEPENIEVLFNKAEALQLINNLEDAIFLYSQVIETAKETGGNIIELAERKRSEAQSVLCNRAGGLLMKEGNFEEARQEFLNAIELNPNDRRNYMNIGVIHLKQGDIDQAIEWMEKTIEIDNGYIRCYYNLGTIYLKKGWYKHAIDIFEKALQIAPDDVDAEDINTNLQNAIENLKDAESRLLEMVGAEVMNISLDEIASLATSVIGDEILSVDSVIQNDGKYRFIAYSQNAVFNINSKNNKLDIEEIER